MGVTLWHGTLRAHRYTIACPRCSGPASTDCDALGRTVVTCPACSSAPFLMPIVRAPEGSVPLAFERATDPATGAHLVAPWPVDVSGLEPEPGDFRPIAKRARGSTKGGRNCLNKCGRAVAPRGKYCRICAPIKAAETLAEPCVNVDRCGNRRSLKSERCRPCQLDARAEQLRAISRARTEAARAARGGVDRRRRGSKGAAACLT